MLLLAVLGSPACRPEAKPVNDAAFVDPVARRALLADAVGCYELFGRDRKPSPDAFMAGPELVELTGEPAGRQGANPDDAWHVRALGRNAAGLQDSTATSWWAADSTTDTIRIVLSDRENGVDFILDASGVARGDSVLEGRAREHGTTGPARWDRGAASARRVPCVGTAP